LFIYNKLKKGNFVTKYSNTISRMSDGWYVMIKTVDLAMEDLDDYSCTAVLGPFATRNTARKIQREIKKVLYCAEELENR
jgi:hypothetical protein